MKNRDAILGKISNIRNCLFSIKKATGLDPATLTDQFTQDVFVLNLERATQACIDMANLLIAQNGYELPRSYKHSFAILEANSVLGPDLTERMKRMAGFRNIAIHDYVKLDIKILQAILTKNLADIEDYCAAIHSAVATGGDPVK
jgi:uncharacterized protein YutE (UPF0331/DUF86 family)